MKIILGSVLLLALSSCFSGSAEVESACKSSTLTLNVVPGISIANTASIQIDYSAAIKHLKDLGNVDVKISRNVLSSNSGDFSWVKHITITIRGVANERENPEATLIDQDVFNNQDSLNLHSVMSNEKLLSYLSQGAVELLFNLSGTSINTFDLNEELCVSATVHITKHI